MVAQLFRGLGDRLAAEQDRLFLWLPVAFGGGVALYFALSAEPLLAPIVVLAGLALLLTRLWRRGLASLVCGGALAGAALGLLSAKLASDRVAAPILERELRAARITGWIELAEPRAAGGERIIVRVHAIEGLAPERTPRRVRVRIPAGESRLVPGTGVRLLASLLPPAPPALPGAHDFGRAAWFLGLGAVGAAPERPVAADIEAPIPLGLRLWTPVEVLRQRIGERVAASLAGERGAIAAALITGERGGITEATNTAYRDSGIFHILSISGLHMSIFAGALYLSVRFLLSLAPALALRFEIKKWAAVAGLAGTLGYLVISGGSPPAVRSALMLAIMFLAVLLDRPALALRNVALAALVILAVSPASLIDVGFQMSFAAVVALIAGLEAWRAWLAGRSEREAPAQATGGALVRFLGAIAATTLIATAAVAPFAAYYFHKSTQYGVLANLVAVPVCNLIVMPAALATLLAMPFGLEAWPLVAMGHGIDAMTWVAYRVAALPGAVALVPAIPTLSFALLVGGGLWLCLWAGSWRLLGLLPMLAGLALAPMREAPDVLVGAGGGLVAVRDRDGRLAVLGGRRSAFELERWLEHDADPRPARSLGPGRTFTCDAVGCQALVRGAHVAVALHPAALGEDCGRADVLIWLGAGPMRCGTRRAAVVITRAAVARDGTHTVAISTDGSTLLPNSWLASWRSLLGAPAPAAMTAKPVAMVTSVAQWRGRRPWVRAPAPIEPGHDRSAAGSETGNSLSSAE